MMLRIGLALVAELFSHELRLNVHTLTSQYIGQRVFKG